jgi:F0F1-type ATP synthase delta subunit
VALKLPIFLTSKKDLLKLRREVERLSESVLQQRVAKSKAGVNRQLYDPSHELKEFLAHNNIDYAEENLKKIGEILKDVYDNALQIRLSFASEPDQRSLEKLIEWFRNNTTPAIFIQVGIQPMITGGVVLRTRNKRYDFSLRSALLRNSEKLMETIRNVSK